MSKLIREEAQTALRLDPKNDYAWHVLGRWNYELANFNPLLKALAQAIYGKVPDASNEQAVECFRKAIALEPRRVSHHLELARAYLALGEKQKARDEFNKGISLPSADKDDEENKSRARKVLKQLQ
jgi:Flp pilus assembly protein TadD